MELSEKEKKRLMEVITNASEYAAHSLHQMTGKQIMLGFPSMRVRSMPVAERIGEDAILGVLDIDGDIKGSLLVNYDLISGLKLIDMILGEPPDTLKEITEQAKEAFSEFLKEIGGNFVSTLGEDLHLSVETRFPRYVCHIRELSPEIYEKLKQQEDDILLIDTNLKIEDEHITGDLFLILDEESLDKIESSLKTQKK